jgi:copper transport protein
MTLPLLLVATLVGGLPGAAPTLAGGFPGAAPILPGAALPHTVLLESRPAPDATVPPEEAREIVLRFSTPVQLPLSRIQVVDAQGREVATGPLGHPGEAPDHLAVDLPARLVSGTYTVEWRAGAPDNHLVTGTFTFQVEEEPQPVPPAEPPPPGADTPPPPSAAAPALPAGTGTRWTFLLGMVLLLGVTAFRFAVVRRLSGRGEMVATLAALAPRLRRLGWLGALLLVASLPLRLLDQVGAGGTEVALALLFRSAWGAGWFFHGAAAALAVVGLVLLRGGEDRERGWGILAGGALLLPLVPALSGHAWGADPRGLAVPAMALHAAGAGVWLGGLLVLLAAGLPAVRKAEGRSAPTSGSVLPPLARLVNAYSAVALPAVVVLLLSGAASSFLQTGGPGAGGMGALLASAWGRTLALKLALVAGILLLGFHNWRRVRPALAERPDAGSLRIPATVEAILGLLVLLVTAILVALPTP